MARVGSHKKLKWEILNWRFKIDVELCHIYHTVVCRTGYFLNFRHFEIIISNSTQKHMKLVSCKLSNLVQNSSSVQFSSSVVSDSVTPWIAAHQASMSITNFRSSLKLIESVMPSNHLTLCRSLLLPSIFPKDRHSINNIVFVLFLFTIPVFTS